MIPRGPKATWRLIDELLHAHAATSRVSERKFPEEYAAAAAKWEAAANSAVVSAGSIAASGGNGAGNAGEAAAAPPEEHGEVRVAVGASSLADTRAGTPRLN